MRTATSGIGVRREKAALSSGCKPHPATAPAGSNLERAQKALRLRGIIPFDHEEPFAAIIRCTADPGKVDKRTRSKWSRALRYALKYKSDSERLDRFIKRK